MRHPLARVSIPRDDVRRMPPADEPRVARHEKGDTRGFMKVVVDAETGAEEPASAA
jgi:hypothetical protein